MRNGFPKILAVIGYSLLAVVTVVAQTGDCPAIVDSAMDALDRVCTQAGRNQVCYGNVSITAQFQTEATGVIFEQVGDIISVADIQSMQLSPMDEENGVWGLALMKLQANIPDTVPGQNVTFLLFGDVQITSALDQYDNIDATPMQAFYLQTGVGDAGCEEAPESGLLVQTPEGINEIVFNINGVDVAMGSTILFQAQPNQDMSVSALEGSAMINIDGEIFSAVEGTQLRVLLDESLQALEAVGVDAYTLDLIQNLPIDQLERQIEIALPMLDEQLAQLQQLLDEGLAPCGQDFLPDCDDLPIEALQEGLACLQEGGVCRNMLEQLSEWNFEIPDFDLEGFDLENLDIDIPGVDIEIPDFEVPDIEVPGFDLTGSD